MQQFKFDLPVTVFAGDDCVKSHPEVFSGLGKKALIITYRFPEGLHNVAAEDCQEILDSQGGEYFMCYDVKEDPPVHVISEIRDKTRDFQPDYIIAIGGGSAIDTAKCVSVLLKEPDRPAIDVLFGGKPVKGLPIVAIPTTCGTGSEVTCWSAVTRDDIVYKGAISFPVWASYAFIDSKYIEQLPVGIARATAIDALCHNVETYLSSVCNPACDAFSIAGIKLFSTFKDALKEGKFEKEQLDNMMLASTYGGIAMMSPCVFPHTMSYPISLDKHVPHGLACGATLAAWLKLFKEEKNVKRVKEVLSWAGFADTKELDDYLHEVIDIKGIGATREDIQKWTDAVAPQKDRFAKHPEPATPDDVYRMYEDTFFTYFGE